MSTQLTYTRGNTAQTIVFDSATRTAKFSATLTESPQERAATVTDGWINNPDEVTINARLSDYPISSQGGGIGVPAEVGRATRLLNEIIKIKSEGLVCLLKTPWKDYDSVRIQSISVDESKPTKGHKEFSISFKQSVIANSQTVPLVTRAERKPKPTTDKGSKGTEGAGANKANKSYAATALDKAKAGTKQLLPGFFTH